MKIVFASGNKNKLQEIQAALPLGVEIVSMRDVGVSEEIPETTGTLEGNAEQKARFVFEKTGLACFSDDTGLEIEALNGRPGVDSAIYAGEPRSSERNIEKVLKEMEGQTNRNAQFRSVFCYCSEVGTFYFEGIVKGKLGVAIRGTDGFGYDGIFHPEGNSRTFAQMSIEEKKMLSHRAKALKKFLEFIKHNS
jgi:XTP/dITP diphosphohydrolase